ncbi:MAG TPA: FHA domain-containing protein [Woeseiaceae bacterium]|nr:FHA domain-containing protein [Woeseiaceae bacterium]
MDLAAAGLTEQPFLPQGTPESIVAYASHLEALETLRAACRKPHGLALLQGPPLSGKSMLIRHLVTSLEDHEEHAVVDGTGLNNTTLLESALREFGYEAEFDSDNELLAMLRVFAMHQVTNYQPPLLVIENTHRLNPSALRALCSLAELRARKDNRLVSALKIVLVSDRPLASIVEAPAMGPVSGRIAVNVQMRPMSCDDAKEYLREKLRRAGSRIPEYVFPNSVCVELWDASGGWPGVLDRIAQLALARAESLPVSLSAIERPALPHADWNDRSLAELEHAAGVEPEPPKLFVTRDGETLKELTFNQPRLLIGRSEHNDIAIPSRFVSRHHLLLVRHGSTTFMMDLNSSNGTFVNSKRVSNHVLIDNDIITVGNHRIKFCDPFATSRGAITGNEFTDTAIMKTLDDMRNLLAQENTAMLPIPSENLPTYGNKTN